MRPIPAVTIQHILILITAGLTLMIALLSGRDLYTNSERLGRAHALRDAIAVSDLLFDATNNVSVERDLALAMLQSSDSETSASLAPALADSRRLADASLAQALTALGEVRAPHLEEMRATLTARLGEIQAMRPELDAAFALLRERRNPELAGRWEDAATNLMEETDRLWVAFIGPHSAIEPVITQHLVYRNALRTVTDYTGRERSIIGQ
ncbi:MAG TPA: hypothetical protein VM915_11400, partial [Verrucomicrobiae bacterium]|nr:hypothetical protein [Verrucomicrobiae bacterium]